MRILNRILYQNTTFLLCMTLVAGLAAQATAQEIEEQVTVTAAFEPSVPDASKLSINPSSNETEVPLPVMTYDIQARPMETSLQPDDISAVKLVGEPQKKLYRNYARIGFGNYTTPLAEFYANSLRSKSYSLGMYFKHFSSSGVIKDYPKSSNSLNIVRLNGEKYFDEHTLSAQLGYRRNVVYQYGFKPTDFETFINEDDLKQRFSRINGSVGFKSNYSEKDKLNHEIDLSLSNVSDLFNTRESALNISGKASKRFELLDFTDSQVLGLETDINLTHYKDSTLKQNSTMVVVKPYISTTFEEYSLKLGLNLTVQGDSVSKVHLFPMAEGSIRIIDDALVVQAGFTGNLQRKGFNTLSDINPFIQSVLPLKYTRERFAFYAAIRGRVGKAINLHGSVRSSSLENEVFFVNDFSRIPYNQFTLVYDKANLFTSRLEAEYNESGRINIKAWAQYDSWKMNLEAKPWHKPALKTGGEIRYNMQDKITARAGIELFGKQYAKTFGTEGEIIARQLNGYADISLGLEYRYTKLLSAFLQFNNILGTRYYQWNNYPGYRFNLLGGISYSF